TGPTLMTCTLAFRSCHILAYTLLGAHLSLSLAAAQDGLAGDLQRRWVVTAAEAQRAPDALEENAVWEFGQREITTSQGRERYRMQYRLNTTVSPAQIDIWGMEDEKISDWLWRGILRTDGQHLRMAVRLGSRDMPPTRPNDFQTKKEDTNLKVLL